MDPQLLQKQLRENATDYNDFYNELKSWGDEMRRREVEQKGTSANNLAPKKPPENVAHKTKRTKTSAQEVESKPKKKLTTDYSAWDKFDADAECERVDYRDSEESDLTDEYDGAHKEEAFLEKEKGNKFVKSRKWDEAIACYTKAINLYSYDPIFYANRALCYLKKQNMEKVVSDCSLSLKLDNSYVKAYQRRAAAREALDQLEEAESDLLTVLSIEPNNSESKKILEALRKKIASCKKPRPPSKFTASRSTIASNLQKQLTKAPQLDTSASHWPSGDDDIMLVKPVNKPVHMRSKKPLKRIEILEIDGFSQEVDPSSKITVTENTGAFPRADSSINTLKTDDLKIIEKKESAKVEENPTKTDLLVEAKKTTEVNSESSEINAVDTNLSLAAPKNSVQFTRQWKHLKTLEAKSAYLKLIKPKELPDIFKESFESSIFTQILEVLSEHSVKNEENVYEFLFHFTEIKRFGTFIMFLDVEDKKRLSKMLNYVKEVEGKSASDIQFLIDKYEL